jgi:predicted site-specific integrase-resolvase
MKLSKWANKQGIHYQTAWRWFKKGLIPNAYQFSTGSIFVKDETLVIGNEKTFSLSKHVNTHLEKS